MHPKARQAQDPFEISVREVTPGVYLAYRPDPFRTPVEGNATIIVNEADVVVVEGGGVQLSAERVIARIREITDKPC